MQSTSEVESIDEASVLPEGQYRVERLIAKRKKVAKATDFRPVIINTTELIVCELKTLYI